MKANKTSVLIAVLGFGIGATIAPAFAETRPVTKGPAKTMGSEGELPATRTIGGHVPNMGTVDENSEVIGPDGRKRLGDQGKLPATNGMSGAVPQMRGTEK
jgi:hypothetical protein